MRSVRSRDTQPEMLVRRVLHSMGYRYRLHDSSLPGSPDIVFRGRRKVVFVNGCFWHGHACARGSRVPKSNRPYWESKVAGNRARDVNVNAELETLGWSVLTVWECELHNPSLPCRLRDFLDG